MRADWEMNDLQKEFELALNELEKPGRSATSKKKSVGKCTCRDQSASYIHILPHRKRLLSLTLPTSFRRTLMQSEFEATNTDLQFIDPRIAVSAQRALITMSRSADPTEKEEAFAILASVKNGRLRGLYEQNMQEPSLLAKRNGLDGYWQLLLPGQNSGLLCEGLFPASAPMFVYHVGLAKPVIITEIRTMLSPWLPEIANPDFCANQINPPQVTPKDILVCQGDPMSNPELVSWAQTSLNSILGLSLPITGVPDVMTRSALRSFQAGRNLSPSGKLNLRTQRAAEAESATTAPCSVSPCADLISLTDNTGLLFRRILGDISANSNNLAELLTRAVGLPGSATPNDSIDANEPDLQIRLGQIVRVLQSLKGKASQPENQCGRNSEELGNIEKRIEQLNAFYTSQINLPIGNQRKVGTRRLSIVSIALAEIGKVRAQQTSTSNGIKQIDFGEERIGWERLDIYYKEAGAYPVPGRNGVNTPDQIRHKKACHCITDELTKAKQCGRPGKNPTTGERLDCLTDWCTIFDVWAIRSAGITTRNWGDNNAISKILQPTTRQAIKPGDVAHKKEFDHTAIIVQILDNGQLVTIDGNTGGQSGATGGLVAVNTRPLNTFFSFWDAEKPLPIKPIK